MADVTATEFAATGAGAVFLDRPSIFGVFGIFQIECASGCKRGPIPRESRWQYAIEHVRSARDHLQQLRRRAQTHGVTRLVVRQKRFARFNRPKHFLLRFANTASTTCVAIEIKIDNRLSALLTQFFKRRSLHDPED